MPGKTILGIDIGMSGALAFYDEDELMIWDMPIFAKSKGGNDLDIKQLANIIFLQKPDMVYIERAMLMPSNGKTAYQKLGKAEGAILGILAALNIPYVIVSPSTWKAFFNVSKDKEETRRKAGELLPQFAHNWPLKKHDGRAESALIALYGSYQEKSKIIL